MIMLFSYGLQQKEMQLQKNCYGWFHVTTSCSKIHGLLYTDRFGPLSHNSSITFSIKKTHKILASRSSTKEARFVKRKTGKNRESIVHLPSELFTICNQSVHRFVCPLSYHNLTQHHYEFELRSRAIEGSRIFGIVSRRIKAIKGIRR
jgi:hypothetical protein